MTSFRRILIGTSIWSIVSSTTGEMRLGFVGFANHNFALSLHYSMQSVLIEGYSMLCKTDHLIDSHTCHSFIQTIHFFIFYLMTKGHDRTPITMYPVTKSKPFMCLEIWSLNCLKLILAWPDLFPALHKWWKGRYKNLTLTWFCAKPL